MAEDRISQLADQVFALDPLARVKALQERVPAEDREAVKAAVIQRIEAKYAAEIEQEKRQRERGGA